jgi:hypothetical protein
VKTDSKEIIILFNNTAAKIYLNLFKQFSESIGSINRYEEENVFRMQMAKFIDTLKYRLEDQVKKILEVSDPQIHNQLQAALSEKVNYYLQEFQLKCNAL